MMLFRSVLDSDLEAIHHLAEQSGVGMTTLPKEKELLKKRITWSADSCKKDISERLSEYYLFVLENPNNQEIVGISAIESCIGYETPFYSYKVSKRTRLCPSLNIRNDYDLLHLVNDNQGHSEICTLFLSPEYRKNNNGLLLSKARFLFMAHYPKRFAPTIIADLRGVSDEQGQSPFWNDVGAHFFPMPYAEADRLTLATNKQFIADLMPNHPLYVNLLSAEAQAVIGKAHPSTLPAMSILRNEGFRYNNYVDIFDAGPTVEAFLPQIKTIKTSDLVTIKDLRDELIGPSYLLANPQLAFRATLGHVELNHLEQTVVITKNTAKILNVQCGDTLRISPL